MDDVPVGTPGEALIKAPTVFMYDHPSWSTSRVKHANQPIRHYRKNPKETSLAFYKGWLRTGDSLVIDADGHLWFQDRKKDMIKYKGSVDNRRVNCDLLLIHVY
jgi:4-coumarate--CoA ligase